MKRVFSTAAAAGLAVALAACGGKNEAPNNAAEHDMNTIMEATSPFADAEIRMNDAMMNAVGVNVGDSWVRKMIEHHKGAIAMSREVLTMNPDANLAEMAHQTIDKQTKDIAALQKLVVQGQPDPVSADLYQPTMDKMHQAMMGATGSRPSETYLRKMLEHHKGAVAMSDVALGNGVSGALRAQVEKTKKMSQDDIKVVEAMLSGKPMKAAKDETSASADTTRTAAAQPKPAAKPATKPALKPAPPPAPDPHAGHDMNTM